MSGDNFRKLSFFDNGMKNQHLSSLHHTISSKPQLESLELSGQLLTGDSLDFFCSIFKGTRNLQKLILTNNQLGVGNNIKEKMTFFMQSFFNDLSCPLELDLSYNMIDDECLHPLIKYLFANMQAQTLAMVNLEWNNFSNKGKRTIVVGYSKCYNKKLQCKFGPLPLTQATLKQAVAVSPLT
jgi:Ran GTPase-activating protein (RanGAP) involved in mRNA processing and transport